MALKNLLKKNKTVSEGKTVSDENAEMLPDTKKSKSEIATKTTNNILILVALAMIGVFIVGILLKANRNSNDISMLDKATELSQEQNNKGNDNVYIDPTLKFEPNSIKIEDQPINEEILNQILLTVYQNPIKVKDISLSYNMDGLNLDAEDCISREKLFKNSSCTLTLSWTPTKKENKNLFIIVKYDMLDDNTVKGEKTDRISVSLQSSEAPTTPEPIEDIEEEDDSDYEISEDLLPETSVKKNSTATSEKPKRTALPDDCKKYASKAYDFSGTFIGWVQGNSDVFSPNCSKIIGTQEDDGMIMETGTGRVIGKGVILDKKKSEEKRIEQDLPLLNEIMQTIGGGAPQPSLEDIMANRQLAREQAPRTSIDEDGTEDLYRIKDTLGIFDKERKKLIPLGIEGTDQVSSLPKDERYVLRQSKPIPAVLNRPVYFSSDVDNNQIVTATVERNVFGGNGRTIIIPSGSQLIGVATHPGAVGIQAVQKVGIEWSRLIRPDGAEFNLKAIGNYSADAQGRAGVPGKNDTEYMQQLFVKPLLYSVLPVAMEALFPSTSSLVTRVRRSDGTYQTIDQRNLKNVTDSEESGDYSYAWNDTTSALNMTSKDKMKAEVQQNFKSIMNKLIEDSAKQKIPFTVPAGTRIQVFLNKDVMLRIIDDSDDDDEEEDAMGTLITSSNKKSESEGGMYEDTEAAAEGYIKLNSENNDDNIDTNSATNFSGSRYKTTSNDITIIPSKSNNDESSDGYDEEEEDEEEEEE